MFLVFNFMISYIILTMLYFFLNTFKLFNVIYDREIDYGSKYLIKKSNIK